MENKFDIVISGPINKNTFNTIKEYSSIDCVNKIIISAWKDQELYKPFGKKVKSIFSNDVAFPGSCNRNRQITSSLNGILAAESDIVLRHRSDQYWCKNHLEKLFEFFINNNKISIKAIDSSKQPKGAIFTPNYFPEFPFHPNDWLMFGYKDDLIKLYDIPHDMEKYTSNKKLRAEIYLTMRYFAMFDERVSRMVKDPQNYLVDNCKNYEESLSLSNELASKVIKPLPLDLLHLKWYKYGENWFDWEFQKSLFKNLIFHENDPNA